jgi:integrase
MSRGGVAQLVEHLLCTQRVAGSNPVTSTIFDEKKIKSLYKTHTGNIQSNETPLPDSLSHAMAKRSNFRKSSAKNFRTFPPHQHPLLVDKGWFSVHEAALILNKSEDTITRYCHKGLLLAQPVTFGKRKTYQIARQALLIYLYEESQKEQVEQTKPVKAAKTSALPPTQAELLGRFQRTLETGFEKRVYSPRTVQDYMHYLALYFAKYDRVEADYLENELMALAHTKAVKVHYYKAVHCFARFLIHKKVIEDVVLDDLKRIKPPENKNPERHVIRLPEMTRLDTMCETLLERLILRTLAYTGIRVSEACQVNWGDIDWEEATLTIWKGKGNKFRQVSLPAKALEVLQDYRKENPHTPKDKPLFINRDGNRMTPRGMHDRLESLGKRAGLKVHPHALRRAFVTISANHGVPVVALQYQCGHRHLATTSKYLRTSEQEALDITRKIDW